MTVEELNVIVSANKDDFDRKIRQVNDNLVNVKSRAKILLPALWNLSKVLLPVLHLLG